MGHAVTISSRRQPVLADRLVRGATATRAADVALVVAGAALLALATQVRIPLGFTPVPLTGQTFAVLLLGAALGLRRGAGAVALYLVVGAAGLPVFTQGGSGVTHFVGATGGYLVGFLAAVALLGWLAERQVDRRVLPALGAMLAASAIIYGFGVAWLIVGLGMPPVRALQLGVAPFLLVDGLKAVAAGLLLPAAWRFLGAVDGGRERQAGTADRDGAR